MTRSPSEPALAPGAAAVRIHGAGVPSPDLSLVTPWVGDRPRTLDSNVLLTVCGLKIHSSLQSGRVNLGRRERSGEGGDEPHNANVLNVAERHLNTAEMIRSMLRTFYYNKKKKKAELLMKKRKSASEGRARTSGGHWPPAPGRDGNLPCVPSLCGSSLALLSQPLAQRRVLTSSGERQLRSERPCARPRCSSRRGRI